MIELGPADGSRALADWLPRIIDTKARNAMERMLFGLIGANIQKSLSPALQESACEAAGVHGYYHLMDLDALPD